MDFILINNTERTKTMKLLIYTFVLLCKLTLCVCSYNTSNDEYDEIKTHFINSEGEDNNREVYNRTANNLIQSQELLTSLRKAPGESTNNARIIKYNLSKVSNSRFKLNLRNESSISEKQTSSPPKVTNKYILNRSKRRVWYTSDSEVRVHQSESKNRVSNENILPKQPRTSSSKSKKRTQTQRAGRTTTRREALVRASLITEDREYRLKMLPRDQVVGLTIQPGSLHR